MNGSKTESVAEKLTEVVAEATEQAREADDRDLSHIAHTVANRQKWLIEPYIGHSPLILLQLLEDRQSLSTSGFEANREATAKDSDSADSVIEALALSSLEQYIYDRVEEDQERPADGTEVPA
jgi:hypothetical protein